MPGGKTKGNYVAKENEDLIRRLAQKSCAEKIIRLASRSLAQIKKITRDYEDEELEAVYLKEHEERKKRIQPVEVVWEHDGRMVDPVYAQSAVRKIHAYEKNGIFPGERLILTFETEKTILDMNVVEMLMHRYLI